MKSSRLLVVVVAFALFATGMIALWKMLDTSSEPSTASRSGATTGSTEGPTTTPAVSAPTPDEVAQPAVDARRDSAPAFTGADQNFDLTGAREIAGRVVVPAGAPADDSLRVWVVDYHGEEATGRFFFGNADDPAGLLAGIESKKGARWAHRPVGADGTFRVPAPSDATQVKVVLDGRYLYIDETTTVELPRTGAELALEAKLGAWIVASCTLPAGARVEDRAKLGEARIFAFSMGGRRGGRGIRRSVPIAPDWTFEMRGVAVHSRMQLVVEPERFARLTDEGVKLEAGAKFEPVYAISMGTRLTGRVLSDAGAPIPVATISIEREKESGRFRSMTNSFMGLVERAAVSDTNGEFALYGIEPEGGVAIAKKDGWVAARSAELVFTEGAALEGVELRMGSGAAIAGIVVLADGKPAADAQVTLEGKAPTRTRTTMPGARSSGGADDQSSRTDAEGRFRFTGLEGGPFELSAALSIPHPEPTAPGDEAKGDGGAAPAPSRNTGAGSRGRRLLSFGRSEGALLAPGDRTGAIVRVARIENVAAGTVDARIVLGEPPGVRGRVVDPAGRPIARFTITVSPDWEDDPIDSTVHAAGFESADGSFLVEGVPNGKWTVSAAAEGAVLVGEEPVVELPAKDPVVLTLERAASIAGVVLDPNGAPLPKARVQRRSQGDSNPFAGLGRNDVECDEEGRFVLKELAGGSYELIATGEGWAKGTPFPVTVEGGEELASVTLTLRMGGTLEGEVYDARGEKVTGRSVQLFSMTGDQRQPTLDGEGRFREEHLTPGTYQVMLQPDMDAIEKAVDEAGDEPDPSQFLAQMKMTSAEIRDSETTQVVLGAPPKAPVRVHGKITRGGENVTKGAIVVLNEGGALMQNMKFGKVTPDGRYEVTLDQPGDVVLVYSKSLGGNQGTEFFLSVPEVAEWEHDLAIPQSSIRGTVYGPDGKPASGVRVESTRSDAPMSLMAMGQGNGRETDENGRYVLDELNPGTYSVAAGGSGTAMFGVGGDSTDHGRVVRGGLRVEADKPLEGIDLRLETPGKIAGVVRDNQGKAVSGATVYARGKDGELVHRMGSVQSDASGKFTYEGLAPGSYTLSARTKTHAARDGGAVTVRSNEEATAEIVIEEGTTLRVTLTDKDDKPVRASISVKDERGNEVAGMVAIDAMMELMSQGISTTERKFGPLAPGKYVVTATTTDGKTVKKPVTLSGQDERKLRLRPE